MPNDEFSKLKKIIGKIKSTNFALGESQNDYKSSNFAAFNYNNEKAKQGRGILDSDKVKELKATHYTLGRDTDNFVTSTRNTYLPKDVKYQIYDNQDIKKSSIDFNTQAKIKNEERMKSMYMADFDKKPIDY